MEDSHDGFPFKGENEEGMRGVFDDDDKMIYGEISLGMCCTSSRHASRPVATLDGPHRREEDTLPGDRHGDLGVLERRRFAPSVGQRGTLPPGAPGKGSLFSY